MGKFKDITGEKFGMLTAVEVAGKNKQGFQWRCKCDCGNEVIVNGANLRSGISQSCGCKRLTTLYNSAINLTGQRFGRLVVVERAGSSEYHRALWKCKCDCGNEVCVVSESLRNGATQSCGCLHSELVSQKQTIDLIGLRFGKLTVLERVSEIGAQKVKYRCICDCGNETVTDRGGLCNGTTKSCGCYQKERASETHSLDLVGKKFGKLMVIKRVGSKDHKSFWECLCDCGKTCCVLGESLVRGNTESCGCLQSRGENMIEKFLNKHHIEYQRQKCFIGCKDINYLPFDFYIPSHNLAIEFDGIFHYKVFEEYHNDLEGQQRHDAIKDKYCEENGIVLLRIPYWEKQN